MKMNKMNKRLVLKKETIGNLSLVDMAVVQGGQEDYSCEIDCHATIAPCDFTIPRASLQGGDTCQ